MTLHHIAIDEIETNGRQAAFRVTITTDSSLKITSNVALDFVYPYLRLIAPYEMAGVLDEELTDEAFDHKWCLKSEGTKHVDHDDHTTKHSFVFVAIAPE